MNADVFRQAITAVLGVDIGVRWRTIALPRAGSARKENIAKALHFEVDVAHRVQATRGLRKLYGSMAKVFPLSVKLRFVPVSSSIMNLKTREKAESFRLRQLQFCTHMVAMRSWEILSLDTPDSSGLPTIRERINTLPSFTMEDVDLFHSIDNSFQQGAVVFTFHPDREEEARAMVIGLIPYLKWQVTTGLGTLTRTQTDTLHSKYVYRYFSQEAIDRSYGAVWNTETNCVDSPHDREVDALDEVDPEFDLSRFVSVTTDDATVTGDEPSTRIRPHDVEGDDETLSTIGTGGSLPSIQEQVDNSVGSTTGSISSTSINSLDKALLAQFREMLPGLQAMASSMPSTANSTVLRTGLMSAARLLSPVSEAKKSGGAG